MKLRFAFISVLGSTLFSCTTESNEFVLDAQTVLFVSKKEPSPKQTTVRDLTVDMKEVFGKQPLLTSKIEDGQKNCIMVSSQENLPLKAKILTAPERFIQKAFISLKPQMNKALLRSGSEARPPWKNLTKTLQQSAHLYRTQDSLFFCLM